MSRPSSGYALGIEKKLNNMDTINMVPEFTQDTPVVTRDQKEVVQPTPEEVAPSEEEKETPAEPPAVEKPADEVTPVSDDTGGTSSKESEIKALQEERVKLLRDLADLRGQRRELKQQQVDKVEQTIDELKDIHPEDVSTIEKVLRSKGYVPKQQVEQMFYEAVKNEELNKFLEKYPEYKPENDPNDLNWSSIQKELGFYRMPENPRLVGEVLERAHRAIAGTRAQSGTSIKQHQIKIASSGAGGAQRPSSGGTGKTLDPRFRRVYEDGGWSEEEIKKIEANLE